MKEFILDALKAKTTPDFKLEHIFKAGKIDIACQFVISSLWIAKDVRRDVIVHLCFSGPSLPPKTISFYGKDIQGLLPTEQSIAQAIKNALTAGIKLNLEEEKQVSPGVIVAKRSVEKVMRNQKNLFYLHQNGTPIDGSKIPQNSGFVIGDYIGVPKNTEKLLKRIGAKSISLGPKMIFAAHCPTIINNELDKNESNN